MHRQPGFRPTARRRKCNLETSQPSANRYSWPHVNWHSFLLSSWMEPACLLCACSCCRHAGEIAGSCPHHGRRERNHHMYSSDALRCLLFDALSLVRHLISASVVSQLQADNKEQRRREEGIRNRFLRIRASSMH